MPSNHAQKPAPTSSFFPSAVTTSTPMTAATTRGHRRERVTVLAAAMPATTSRPWCRTPLGVMVWASSMLLVATDT